MSIIGRLISAIDSAQADTGLMDLQLDRMRDRMRAGVDVNGAPFRPYKRLPRDGRTAPLSRGGVALINAAKVGVVHSLDGADLVARMSGEARKITFYQNRLRQFVGFSEQDRSYGRSDFLESIKNNLR